MHNGARMATSWLLVVVVTMLTPAANAQAPRSQLEAILTGAGLQASSGGAADATTTRGCFSTTDGPRKHGETFQSANAHWKLRCDNGALRIIACYASARANHAEIAVNETKVVNGFWHKCEYIPATQNIRYTQEASCRTPSGQEVKIGAKFRSGMFQFECQQLQYVITGCYFMSATSGEARLIALGASVTEGRLKHSCATVPGGGGRVRYSFEAIGCVHDGKTYNEGDTWRVRSAKMQCFAKGAYGPVACYTRAGDEIAVGANLVKDNLVHLCYKEPDGRMFYRLYSCGGTTGVSCVPPADNKTVPTSSGGAPDGGPRVAPAVSDTSAAARPPVLQVA